MHPKIISSFFRSICTKDKEVLRVIQQLNPAILPQDLSYFFFEGLMTRRDGRLLRHLQ